MKPYGRRGDEAARDDSRNARATRLRIATRSRYETPFLTAQQRGIRWPRAGSRPMDRGKLFKHSAPVVTSFLGRMSHGME